MHGFVGGGGSPRAFVSTGKDFVSLLRDGVLLALALLLMVFPKTFNARLVDAGFQKADLMGMEWKSGLVNSNATLADANKSISDLQEQNAALLKQLSSTSVKPRPAWASRNRSDKMAQDATQTKVSTQSVQERVSQHDQGVQHAARRRHGGGAAARAGAKADYLGRSRDARHGRTKIAARSTSRSSKPASGMSSQTASYKDRLLLVRTAFDGFLLRGLGAARRAGARGLHEGGYRADLSGVQRGAPGTAWTRARRTSRSSCTTSRSEGRPLIAGPSPCEEPRRDGAFSFDGLQQKGPWWDCKGMKRAASARPGPGAALAGCGATALVLVAFVATALSATAAEAQPAPAEPAGAATVVLIVRADDKALDRRALRRAIEDEIAAPVILDGDGAATDAPRRWLTVGLDTSRNELAVSLEEPGREMVTRVVPAPSEAGALIQRAAWLAGNLLRDEASELLPERRPAAPPPAAPPPAPPRVEAPAILTVAPTPTPHRFSPVTAALFFPLATNFDAPDVHTRLNLNVLYGRVGALEGMQLGGANQVDGEVSGAQLGFLFNVAGGDVRGLQVASVANLARSDVHGFQVALLTNHAHGDLEGFQVSAVNTTGGDADGGQFGAINVAGGDVRGLQLGFVNVARNVRGIQLGLVNVADDVEGVPIGIVSVTKTGGVHPVLWAGGAAYVNVGIKFSTRYTFTQFSGSATDEAGTRMYGPGLALGFRSRCPAGPSRATRGRRTCWAARSTA